MKIRITIVMLMALAFSFAGAVNVRHINVREGLSSRQVYKLEQDSDGYMWFFTNTGIDRYDGYHIKHYCPSDTSNLNDHVRLTASMAISPQGDLWVGIRSGELFHYSRNSDDFECVYRIDESAGGLYDFVLTDSGNILAATTNGLYLCSPDSVPRRVSLEGNTVSNITDDGRGGWFAGTMNGLYHIDGSNKYVARFVPGTQGMYIKSLLLIGGKLYIGTFASSLSVLDPGSGHLSRLPADIPALPINALRALGDDKVLVGVDGAGVYLLDAPTGMLLQHYNDIGDPYTSLSGNTVTDIHVDRDEGIWVATSHNGVNYILPAYHGLTPWHPEHPGSAPLSDYVNTIFEDSDGDLWLGTDKGVSRYTPATAQWHHYLSNGMISAVMLAIEEDERGRIWVGNYGNGISIIDKRTGAVSRLTANADSEDERIGTDHIFAIRRDRDGNMWAAGINGLTTRIDAEGKPHLYNEDCIATIIPDKNGNLLFGGNKGLGRYDSATDRFTWTQSFGNETITNPVRSLLSDPASDILWIGTTGDGLVRYDIRQDSARCFTMADGLSSHAIYSLVMDDMGSLWMTTETDLYRYDAATQQFKKFTGILNTRHGAFNPDCAIRLRSGDLMFGTADGCVRFNPRNELSAPVGNKLLFTDLRINGRDVKPGIGNSPINRLFDDMDAIQLASGQNDIDIDFAIINYPTPQRIHYEYMLEGFDTEPRVADKNNTAHYRALPHGHYTFRLKAIDLYTGRTIIERTLPITVQPPFALSPWMVTLYILLGTGMLLLLIGYVRKLQRERAIESQLRSYAAIAHDILTPLSMIKSPLINLDNETEISEQGRKHLSQARAAVNKTMTMLTELLELRSSRNDQPRLQVKPIDIQQYLDIKVEEFSRFAMYKGLELRSNVEDGLTQVLIDSSKLDHIVDNLLSNALKYTEKGYIVIGARPAKRGYWELFVSDTGFGITKAEGRLLFRRRFRSGSARTSDTPGTGMGLLITRRIVQSHRGRISFESTPGKGTTFKVTLLMNYPSRYKAPATDADSLCQDACSDAVSVGSDTRQTIFIVDDDPEMLDFLKNSLSDEYLVRTCNDSMRAISEINDIAPDMIISDVMMPRLDGNELCQMVKSDMATSHIPVVLLTGLTSRRDIVAGLEAQADDYILKPFDIVVLKARIRNILKTRQLLGHKVLADDEQPHAEDFACDLDRKFMSAVMDSVNNHLSDSDYSVGDLCADLAMSRTSVYNKIKSMTGRSLNEFIRIMRLNRSKELLKTGNYTVSEVAYMVGFSDPKYFSTCFKKQFGNSPSKI